MTPKTRALQRITLKYTSSHDGISKVGLNDYYFDSNNNKELFKHNRTSRARFCVDSHLNKKQGGGKMGAGVKLKIFHPFEVLSRVLDLKTHIFLY